MLAKESRTFNVMWVMAFLTVVAMAGCGVCGGGCGEGGFDVTAPTVTLVTPADGATDVPINQALAATFSEAMDPSTITTATFTMIGPGATPVTGVVAYDVAGNTATFTPAGTLAPNANYMATITTGAKDLAGNALASGFIWSFTTGVAPDTTAPMVSFTAPANAATGVAINQKLAATFSKAMDPLTLTTATFTLRRGATPVSGTVTLVGLIATLTPASNLAASTTYTATITTGAKDLAGNALASGFVWSFTTGAAPDTTAPMVSFTVPANAATGVPINQALAATFSEAMDPLTMTAATFTLRQGTTPVSGTVTHLGLIATFTPASNLALNTAYTATITTGAKDLAGNALASNFAWSFTTSTGGGLPSDTTRPTVSSTIPANVAIGVAVNQALAATFSEAMDPLTITTATFTLQQGITPVSGTVTNLGLIATFTPASSLALSTTYTATITTGARDLAGNALASNFVWSFTTGATSDITAPTVSFTAPANGATGVARNQKIAATFSEAMNPLTTVTFTLQQGTTPVSCTVSNLGLIAILTPASDLAATTTYTATITTGATDLAGNALASDFVWSFTTGATSDNTPPTVISTNPADTATGVGVNAAVNATFSEAMDASTITTAQFTLTDPGLTLVTGTVAYHVASNIATFTPAGNLTINTLYTATITTGAKDLAGNVLAVDKVWSFTTAATTTPAGQAPIVLGLTSTFAIMATTATSGGGDQINGDVGLHPGSAQGIPPSEINGTIHINDQAIIDAQADLLAAYNDAVSRSTVPISLPGQIGGLTLAPGLYVNSTSSGISGTGANAILTLDAQGDANAVFIFKMGSTFITDSATSVVLSGGAQAKNVYWQVGSSATLGTTSIFKGNILAAVSITVNSGAAVEGRLFAGSGGGGGAVTVQSSIITTPAP